MIDKLKICLKKPPPRRKNIYLKMEDTDHVFQLIWTSKGMFLECNPNKLFNEEELNIRGNFKPMNYSGFIRAIDFLMEKVKEKLLKEFPFYSEFLIEKLYIKPIFEDSYITEIHVFENVPCKYEAKKYIHDLFANLRIKRHEPEYKALKNTMLFTNKSRQFSIYDKTQQMLEQYKVKPEQLGTNKNYLRIEMRTRKGSFNVEKDWGVKIIFDLYIRDNYDMLREKLFEHINQKLLSGFFKQQKIIIEEDEAKKIIKKYPFIVVGFNFSKFFKKYTDITSYRKYLVNEIGITDKNSYSKSKEYERLEKLHKSRTVNKVLMKELKKYFKTNLVLHLIFYLFFYTNNFF